MEERREGELEGDKEREKIGTAKSNKQDQPIDEKEQLEILVRREIEGETNGGREGERNRGRHKEEE